VLCHAGRLSYEQLLELLNELLELLKELLKQDKAAAGSSLKSVLSARKALCLVGDRELVVDCLHR
jgi:hypothetical protein